MDLPEGTRLKMAIPEITRKSVLAALIEIDRDGVPKSRESRRYTLVHEGRGYPPKYTISLAVKYATGKEMPKNSVAGANPTHS